jgi:hypothetical protein
LTTLLEDYEAHPPAYNVVIYNPAEACRRGITLREETVFLNGQPRTIARAHWGPSGRLIFIDQIKEETHHILFPAFDLILTRAGGGTVNDAIAFRAPLVLVEEPGMWQVEQIRRACVEMGLAESASLEEFRHLGRKCVEAAGGDLKPLFQLKQRMSPIPNHTEGWAGQFLLGANML